MGKLTYLNHLKACAEAARSFTNGLVACQKKGVSRQELNDLCPREYYYDFLTWLCMQANAVAVWNNDCCYGLSINRKQIGTLRKLKMAGVYGGTIPKI